MHHGEGLRRLLAVTDRPPDAVDRLITALATDPLGAEVSDRERAMLRYTVKLTETPGAIEAGDVEALRPHGFDDRAIHDICAICGYYAFVNRIADGLGVELEPGGGS